MLCWICNIKEADSGEHKFKSSQLKRMYGKQFNESIVYVRENKELRLEGPNNKKVKFPKIICRDCNNNLTAPDDKAFDKLIDWSNSNFNQLKSDEFIDFKKVFGKGWLDWKRRLYKYVAKHAGCKIVTSKVENDTTELSNLIYKDIDTNTFQIKFIVKEGFHFLDLLLKQVDGEGLKFTSNSPVVYSRNDFNDIIYFGSMTTYNWLSIAWVHTQNGYKTYHDGFSNQKESLEFLSFKELDEKKPDKDWVEVIDYQNMETLQKQLDFYDSFVH